MQRVLGILFAIIVVALLVTWLASGALRDIAANKDAFANPIGAYLRNVNFDADFRVPPPTEIPNVPQVTLNDSFNGRQLSSYDSLRDQHLAEERARDEQAEALAAAQAVGELSPQQGTVFFEKTRGRATNTNPDTEYVVLRASRANTAPVDVRGWSLQSAVTGVRIGLPDGVRTFRMNEAAPFSPIELAPGASATVVTGVSPVGVSFRMNSCIGYLDQFQDFYPSLSNSCPAPREELPRTVENLQTYGEECIDFVEDLPRCSFYVNDFPATLSNTCRAFVRNALTYNSCVDRHQWRATFNQEDWRVYLGVHRELWQNSHDVIRLLDETGRTVDVWSY